MDILYLWTAQSLVNSIIFNQNICDLYNNLEITGFQTRLQNDLYIDLYLPTGSR